MTGRVLFPACCMPLPGLPVTQVCQALFKRGYLGTGISLFLPFKIDNLLRGIGDELLIGKLLQY